MDRALLARLADVVDEATRAFEAYDYTRALERAEDFFWSFCDDYIELVKGRAYGAGPEADSANRALRLALDVLLRLFAPFLPYATEEVWSWWKPGSVHVQSWPEATSLRDAAGERLQLDPLDLAATVLERVRGEKSRAKTSMKTPVLLLHATGTPAELDVVASLEQDLRNACLIEQLTTEETSEPFDVVRVELGEAPPKAPKA